MRILDVDLDGRLMALLGVATCVAAGIGFAAAAALDGGAPVRVASVAPPQPDPSAEAQENTPEDLPPVVVPQPAVDPAQPPRALPPVPVDPVAPDPVAPTPDPVEPAPTAPPAPNEPAAPPAPPPGSDGAPADDDSAPVPFRPPRASDPLAEYRIPANQFPATDAAARNRLTTIASRPATGGAARRDIAYVLRLGDLFGQSRLPGRRATISRILRVNAWWYTRRGAPPSRVLVRDPDGLLYVSGKDHGLFFNPVGTAGRWQGMNRDITNVQLANALLEVGAVDTRGGKATMHWEYFDVPGKPTAARPGPSGMSQSRISALMAGAYRDTSDPRFLTAATQALASLDVPVAQGGVRSQVAEPGRSDRAPWFVERAYPGQDPWLGGALNGFMVALLEVRSAERSLRAAGPADAAATAVADQAKRLTDEGAASLERFLPLHDSGKWSYYGMMTPGHPWRTYLANITYHCYHVNLLRGLSAGYPQYGFSATADRWERYATEAGVTCT